MLTEKYYGRNITKTQAEKFSLKQDFGQFFFIKLKAYQHVVAYIYICTCIFSCIFSYIFIFSFTLLYYD